MSDVINLTLEDNNQVINLTVIEPEVYQISVLDVATVDPRVEQSRIDAEVASDEAAAAQTAAEAAVVEAQAIVENIGPTIDTKVAEALATKTTTDIAEGTNLYYTPARFDEALALKTTDDIVQGEANKYYATSLFEADLATKSTTDLAEGTNLYHTPERAKAAAVVDSTEGDEVDQAASVAAMKAYVGANGGGGGGSLTWEKLGELLPENESQDGIKLEAFSHEQEQELYLTVNVPENYVAGNPIKLKKGAFFINATSGKVLFKATTALLKAGSTVLGTYSNEHLSINSEVTVSATANQLTEIGELDLTDATGLINAVAVAAGDKLRVKLSRVVGAETSSAPAKAKLMINNFDVTFK